MMLVACGLILASCAHDTYQARANLIKDHADAFYDNLKANRVERVIDTYTNPTDRPYREQALRALKDLDMLNPPTTTTNP
jgi:hypothetical protein